jgi:hypothetical protein
MAHVLNTLLLNAQLNRLNQIRETYISYYEHQCNIAGFLTWLIYLYRLHLVTSEKTVVFRLQVRDQN